PKRRATGAPERGGEANRAGQSRQRAVAIERAPRGGRRSGAASKPGLEMHRLDLEAALGAMDLRIDATDQLPVVKDRQRVVSVRAPVAGRIHLDGVAETEEAKRAVPMPQERVERGQQRRARGPVRTARRRGERGQ